jgi:site-specific DNA-cytosine methylase
VKVLELYSGIGGTAAAVSGAADVVAAVDHDEAAERVYRAWFDHPVRRMNLQSVRADQLAAFDADLWWMSPPCQPFTVRGRSRDVDDPRCRSFLNVLELVASVRPRRLALENVPGFAGSRAHARLRTTLQRAGYHSHELELCPSTLGVPNRRRRFYVVASLDQLPVPAPIGRPPAPLAGYLDPDPAPSLRLSQALLERYDGALSIVDARRQGAIAECFTSAYGKSPVYAGSYLRDADGVRRFSAAELLRLLGFPPRCVLPPDLSERKAYKLVGNSLSVVAVRALLGPWLEVRGLAAPASPPGTTAR